LAKKTKIFDEFSQTVKGLRGRKLLQSSAGKFSRVFPQLMPGLFWICQAFISLKLRP